MAERVGKSVRAAALAGIAMLALAGPWAATQFIAHVFSYQNALGAPVLKLGAARVYSPMAIFDWNDRLRAHYPRPFAVAGLIMLLGFTAAGGALWLFVRLTDAQRIFGAKAWAQRADVVAAGLLAKAGLVLGRFEEDLLCAHPDGHFLLIGPSRKGKGRSHVVPTLLTWPHSALVTDLKGELAQGDPRHSFPGTAGFRSKLGPTLCFAPTRAGSARWNPLFEVRRGDHEVADVQNLVACLMGQDGPSNADPFWDRAAAAIIVGVILHVLYAEPIERKTLAVVRDKLANLKQVAHEMRTTLHRRNPLTNTPEVHPEVLQAANKFLEEEDKLQSSIRATAHSYFGIFADPIVAENTASSDFRLHNLVAGPRPMTLYLQPPPHDLTRFMPTLRFIVEMAGRTLMADQAATLRGQRKRHELLLLLDEFPLLGRSKFIEDTMGAMAGYGLKAYLVCQSPNHIRGTYGRDNTIVDNCHIVAAFGTQEPASAEWISALAGKVFDTIEQVSRRRTSKVFDDPTTITKREEERALISAKEIQSLPASEQLIFVQGCKTIRAKKIAYDQEPVFKTRLLPFAENRGGLTTSHDWSDVLPLGRLEQTGRGTTRVRPVVSREGDPRQGELPLSLSEQASAGLRHPPPPNPPPSPPPQPPASDAPPPASDRPVGEAAPDENQKRRRPRLGG